MSSGLKVKYKITFRTLYAKRFPILVLVVDFMIHSIVEFDIKSEKYQNKTSSEETTAKIREC